MTRKFALTPALSPGERENRGPSRCDSGPADFHDVKGSGAGGRNPLGIGLLLTERRAVFGNSGDGLFQVRQSAFEGVDADVFGFEGCGLVVELLVQTLNGGEGDAAFVNGRNARV